MESRLKGCLREIQRDLGDLSLKGDIQEIKKDVRELLRLQIKKDVRDLVRRREELNRNGKDG